MKAEELLTKIKDENLSPDGALMLIGAHLVEAMTDGGKSHPDMFQDIKDFHMKFKQSYSGPPRVMADKMRTFRLNFMEEELDEFHVAAEKQDIARMIDALFDLVYVAIGTCYLMGVNFNDVWNEGHSSNMSKECVAMGKGKMGYTVHKGIEYKEPDFKQFVE